MTGVMRIGGGGPNWHHSVCSANSVLGALESGAATWETQPKLQLHGNWLLPLSTQEQQALAGDARSQQKQRAELLKNGNQEIQQASMPGLPASWPQVPRAGYWRSQAGNSAQAERLVWVPPRAATTGRLEKP